jgi:hypothetical protein
MNLLRKTITLAACILPACSSSAPTTPTPGVDAGKDSSVDGPCPAKLPAAGDACAREGLVCEYGDDKVFACTTHAVCASKKFQIFPSDKNPGICPSASVCPANPDQPGTAPCTQGASCYVGTRACECVPIVEDPPNPNPQRVWGCGGASLQEGCAAARPRVGTACSATGPLDVAGSCAYVDCGLECRDNVWQPDRKCSERFSF